jgi:DNA-binding response OmpR family regulator
MTKNILIIEDDDFFRELIRKKLSSQDFKVSEAINGEDGLIMIKEERPDLILLDLLLPNIDGFEVLSKIKLDPNNSLIPVIILSNLGQQEDIERGLKLGANDYLIKSQFDIDQVVDKIKGILEKPKSAPAPEGQPSL